MGATCETVRAVSWQEAEAFTGVRLDRRRCYAIGPDWNDSRTVLLSAISWVAACSGCFEAGEYGSMECHYPWDEKARCRVGAGCGECGYTGKRRSSMWAPHPLNEGER